MARRDVAKVTLNFPLDLLEEVDRAAAELRFTRSDLIREALKEYTRALAEEKLERELIEGYQANAALLKRTSEEFEFVDGENV